MVSLLPEEYEFSGIGTHEAIIFQARINTRIETLEEQKQTREALAVIEELGRLALALDQHVSREVKQQENDRQRRILHDAATRSMEIPRSAEDMPLVGNGMTISLTKEAHDQKMKEQGPPYTGAPDNQ
jgi:hypothetical protein